MNTQSTRNVPPDKSGQFKNTISTLFSNAFIEIVGATLEEACSKKGRIFSADLHPILCSNERFG
jgi:hypothetical protein